jgi:dienelactone hydrolase
MTSFPEPVDSYRTSLLEWQLFRLPTSAFPSGTTLDMALAEDDGRTYLVALLADAGEQGRLYDDVFLTAVEALEPTPGTRAAHSRSIHEDNAALFTYDASLPLNVSLSAPVVQATHSEIDLAYDSPRGGRVPATLLIPRGPGPHPGIVMMHGFPSRRQAMLPLGRRYAAAGAVVIMIDAPFARPDINRPTGTLTFGERDREEQIQLMVDLRRAVDLLVGRGDVDPAQLAYVGVSYGGAMGGLLSGLETRLVAYALIVGDGGLVAHFGGLDDAVTSRVAEFATEEMASWFRTMWTVEPSHYVGQAAPAALLFQSGRDDRAVPAAEAHRYQNAGSEPKQIMWYAAGHSLNDQATADQARWLSRHISLDLDAFWGQR